MTMEGNSSHSGGTDGNALTRRRFVCGLGAAGAAAGLAGCTGDGGNGQSTTVGDGTTAGTDSATETTATEAAAQLKLSSWAANNQESKLLKQLLGEFESNHPNISVDYLAVQSKYKQKIKTQLGAGNAPDAFYVDAKYFGSFASQDVLLDLSPVENSESFDGDDFFESLLDAFRYEGTLYGIPKGFSTLGLFYNTAMFEQAGVSAPETWSDLRSGLTKIKEQTDVEYPMIVMPNARSWYAFLFQNGGQILSDDGSEAVFASDAGVEALQFVADLRADGLAATKSQLGTGWPGAALGAKEVAAGIAGPWVLPFLSDKHPDVDENVDVAHLPIPEGGEKATAAYTVAYCASAATESPDATRTLVDGLTSADRMASWASKGVELSARKSHADLDFYANNPRYKTMLDAGEWSHVVGYGPQSEAIINRLNPELEGALLGEKSPRDALETAQQKINADVL